MCFGMCFGLGKTSEIFYVLCHPGVHTAHFPYEQRLCALQDGVIWCIFYVSICKISEKILSEWVTLLVQYLFCALVVLWFITMRYISLHFTWRSWNTGGVTGRRSAGGKGWRKGKGSNINKRYCRFCLFWDWVAVLVNAVCQLSI
jgi:hypothetical protein